MYTPLENTIQLGVAVAAILFVYRGEIPMLAGYIEHILKWRR